jgi:hypothetical protein
MDGAEKPVWTDSCIAWSLKEHKNMLWTIFVILLVLWALGLVTSYTMGGFIHILLVVALVVLVIRIIQGRRIA